MWEFGCRFTLHYSSGDPAPMQMVSDALGSFGFRGLGEWFERIPFLYAGGLQDGYTLKGLGLGHHNAKL